MQQKRLHGSADVCVEDGIWLLIISMSVPLPSVSSYVAPLAIRLEAELSIVTTIATTGTSELIYYSFSNLVDFSLRLYIELRMISGFSFVYPVDQIK